MCMFCKNEKTIDTTTTFLQCVGKCVVVVKNVPCSECTQCGEKFYSDEVADNLENIINNVRSQPQELAMIDYAHAA